MSADEQEKINVHEDSSVKPNPVENEKEIKKLTAIDFWYGVSLFGRILFTLYSIHGVFFIYNFVIQYIIMFPSVLYSNDMSNAAGFFFSCIYA